MPWQVYVVVSVNAEHLFNHVALPVNVYHIGRRSHNCSILRLAHELVIEALENALYHFGSELLSYKRVNPVVVQFYLLAVSDARDTALLDLSLYHAAGNLLDEKGGALEGVDCDGRVRAALIAEGRVCLQGM